MQLDEPNPYIANQNPFEGYQKSIDDLQKTNQGQLEFDRLCYEVFIVSKEGVALYEHINKRISDMSNVNPSHAQALQISFYWAVFNDAMRGLYRAAQSHQQRILAG